MSDKESISDALWNSKLEEVVKHIGEDSRGYRILHQKQAKRADGIYRKLTYIGIVIGPLGSLLQILNKDISGDYNSYLSSIEIMFGFLSGIIVGLMKFGKFDEVSNANKAAAAKYTSIESNVRRQLGMYRENRQPAQSYMDWIESKYNEVLSSAPFISSIVYKEFTREAEINGWRIPNKYEHEILVSSSMLEKHVQSLDQEIVLNNIHVNDSVSSSNRDIFDSQTFKSQPNIKVKRTTKMDTFSEINHCSDAMLNYELNRNEQR